MNLEQAGGRVCVIFNPVARGEKARRFRTFLEKVADRAEFRPTPGPGAARGLAREAVETGHQVIIAAGGDGTVFEVLNGLADAPEGFSRCALGVLPLGTANVLAHELRMPLHPERAWEALLRAHIETIDCGWAEFADHERHRVKARFAIVAGAGLDARAVQIVNWNLKRRFGKLAYIAAALRALRLFPDRVRYAWGGETFQGRGLLAGNGKYYAGEMPVFTGGSLDSGRLHILGVESVTVRILWRCLLAYATGRWGLKGVFREHAVDKVRLEADGPVPLQLDGEFVGWLPAEIGVTARCLRVLVPDGTTVSSAPAESTARPPG